jgi:hypothetical protein
MYWGASDFLLQSQFNYLVGLFLTKFNFVPKNPHQSEHSIKQHSNHAVEQDSARAHGSTPNV